MTDPRTLAEVLWLILGLFLLVFAMQFVVLPSRTDQLRHRVFCLRRELFLMMAEGRIDKRNPAYIGLRNAMNWSLRFAERMDLSSSIVCMLLFRKRIWALTRFRHDVIEAIADPAVRARLRELDKELGRLTFSHSAPVSPIAWILIAGIAIWNLARRGLGGLASFWRNLPRRIVSSELPDEELRGVAA